MEERRASRRSARLRTQAMHVCATDCGNLHRHAAKELRTMSRPETWCVEEALVAYLLCAGFVLGHDVRLAEVEGG